MSKSKRQRTKKRQKRNPEKPQDEWPDEVPEYVPLTGWMRRGRQRDQGKKQGWRVFVSVDPPDADAVPVTIILGHHPYTQIVVAQNTDNE